MAIAGELTVGQSDSGYIDWLVAHSVIMPR
jgi:hypothetical protein